MSKFFRATMYTCCDADMSCNWSTSSKDNHDKPTQGIGADHHMKDERGHIVGGLCRQNSLVGQSRAQAVPGQCNASRWNPCRMMVCLALLAGGTWLVRSSWLDLLVSLASYLLGCRFRCKEAHQACEPTRKQYWKSVNIKTDCIHGQECRFVPATIGERCVQ